MIYSILLYNLSSNFSVMLGFFLSFECLKALIIFKNEAIKNPNPQLKDNISWEYQEKFCFAGLNKRKVRRNFLNAQLRYMYLL